MSGFKRKPQMNCNACGKPCTAKNGDWFHPPGSSGKQVFLCKPCESAAKGSHARVNLAPAQKK